MSNDHTIEQGITRDVAGRVLWLYMSIYSTYIRTHIQFCFHRNTYRYIHIVFNKKGMYSAHYIVAWWELLKHFLPTVLNSYKILLSSADNICNMVLSFNVIQIDECCEC